MRKIVFFIFLGLGLFMLNTKSLAQTDTIPVDFCINAEEYQLYQLINDYRKAFAQAPIALSKSLSYVAKTHAQDLALNFNPDSSCNMHSWSDKGRWIPICFPSEQSKKNSAWLKAKEIIGYPSEAHEIAYWSNVENSPKQILSFWRENKASRNMLLNSEEWGHVAWNAIGVGIKDGYAVVWVGEAIDTEVSTLICGTSTKILNSANLDNKVQKGQKTITKDTLYYITIGSYNNRKDGANAVRSYKEMGYPKAILIENDNRFRVAIDYFKDKKIADQTLKKYAQKFKGAWVLTI